MGEINRYRGKKLKMATVEQQAAEEFQEALREAWNKHRSQKQSISKSVDEPMQKVKNFFEIVKDMASEIIDNTELSIQYDDPEFDLDSRSIKQRYLLSDKNDNYYYSTELTFYHDKVVCGERSYSIESIRNLFAHLRYELEDAFSPK
jgi:hypothetical protein